ncbi:hypothetical protein HBI79_218840 [Parastagonospora nodorum]|nr:hypothetical protein HBI79_218840 [Parastagonospora nodorum]KAH5293826.1 hypothetical protein HBI12_227760 [Parastagonospora nodorum]KAH5395430.1 hypothetical protein HBI47_232240 [Parastagonospora nodorum]
MAYTFSDNSCNPWSTSNPTCTLGGHVAYSVDKISYTNRGWQLPSSTSYMDPLHEGHRAHCVISYIELYNTIHRSYGLSADHVLEWEVVAASGGLIAANPDSHQDLLWALCGIGGARTA